MVVNRPGDGPLTPFSKLPFQPTSNPGRAEWRQATAIERASAAR
jgi:hypothetical protein